MPPGARHRLMGALLTAPENKLLSKQLASISATLASASQRRDTAAKEIASRRMSHSSTPLPPAQLSFGESSTVLEHTTPGHAVPPTTDGCQAVTAVDGAAVELEENAPPNSLGIPNIGSRAIANSAEDIGSMNRELEELAAILKTPAESQGEEQVEDLELLRERLEKILVPSPAPIIAQPTVARSKLAKLSGFGPPLQQNENSQRRDSGISYKLLYYATALQLEKTGIAWERSQGWTTYLFSASSKGYYALKEKHKLVEDAKRELDALIKQTIEEEAIYREQEEQVLRPCRLLLSNIAAGADMEEVAHVFSEFKYDIRHVTMLTRDPVSRAQTAQVVMYTRHAAKQASYTMGSIYGLIVKIHLATDGD